MQDPPHHPTEYTGCPRSLSICLPVSVSIAHTHSTVWPFRIPVMSPLPLAGRGQSPSLIHSPPFDKALHIREALKRPNAADRASLVRITCSLSLSQLPSTPSPNQPAPPNTHALSTTMHFIFPSVYHFFLTKLNFDPPLFSPSQAQ